MQMILRDAKITVTASGRIRYESTVTNTKRTFQGFGSYAESVDWVRNRSAWRREVRYII